MSVTKVYDNRSGSLCPRILLRMIFNVGVKLICVVSRSYFLACGKYPTSLQDFFKDLLFNLRPFQYFFSPYETGQSVGGAKTGEVREKPPSPVASTTWLVSHVPSAVSTFNHSTTGLWGCQMLSFKINQIVQVS